MERMTKAAVVANEIEAQRLDFLLEDEGIPHLVVSYHDSAYDGVFQTVKGWGRVDAPPEYHAAVRRILDDLRDGELVDDLDDES